MQTLQYMQHSLHAFSACARMSLPVHVHANFACRARMQTCMQICMRVLKVHSLQSMRMLEWVDASSIHPLKNPLCTCIMHVHSLQSMRGLSRWMHVHSLQSMRRLERGDACTQLAEYAGAWVVVCMYTACRVCASMSGWVYVRIASTVYAGLDECLHAHSLHSNIRADFGELHFIHCNF